MVTELYKHLDEENIKNLAQILNQMWTEEKVPTDYLQKRKLGTAAELQTNFLIEYLLQNSHQNLPNKTFQCYCY